MARITRVRRIEWRRRVMVTCLLLVPSLSELSVQKEETKMADVEDEIDNDLPDEVISSLEAFYRSMNTVEETLEPIMSMSSEDVHEKLNVLDRAKLDLMTVYAMNSMFWIYLITQGINAKEHGIKHELDRVKNYMGKIKEISDKKKASMKIDKEAAKRFVRSALWKKSDKKEETDQEIKNTEVVEPEKKLSKKEKRKKEMPSQKRKKHKAD